MEKINERKKGKNKKLITQIIATLLFVVISILSIITVTSSVKASNLAFFKYRYYIMKAESHPQVANAGDFVIAKKMKFGDVHEGDNIVYKDGKFYYCDEIIDVKNNNSAIKVIIAEKDGIKYRFSEDDIEGKIVKVIPHLGSVIDFLRTPLGIVMFVLFIMCLFILLRILLLRNR